MKWLIDYFARQGIFSNVITFLVFILGILSLITINREAFPNIKFDMIVVNTIYPGASSEEVEKLVTNPLEQEFKSIDGVKKITSVSIESRSSIILQLDPDQTTEEDARRDVREALDRVTDLPAGAENPLIVVINSKVTPTIEVTLSSKPNNRLSEDQMREQVKLVEEKLHELSGVSRISRNGYRKREIKVKANLLKLQSYHISLQDLIRVLGAENSSIPGGVFQSKVTGKNILIRTVGDFLNTDDVGDTIIRSNALGQVVRVRDVAKVSMGFEEAKVIYHSGGKKAINLVIFKKDGADAIDLVNLIKQELDQDKASFHKGLEVNYVNDLSYYIRRRLSVLSSNMLIGLVLVLTILSFILPGRVALITSLGIPFSFFATFLYFGNMGISLNLLTMIGLIIVVGMLVDDAVVVTENVQRYAEKGLSPMDAAIKGTQQIWAPVTASVMTTVVAFTPMLFMSGITGKFMKFIPLGVILALLFSLYECFFILPHHLANWIKKGDSEKAQQRKLVKWWNQRAIPSYGHFMKKVLERRYLVVSISFALFLATIFLATRMTFILFPASGVEVFQIRFDAPLGTSMDKTLEIIKPIEAIVAKLRKDEVKNFTTQVGLQQENPTDPSTKRGDEYGQINVYLTPATSRERRADEIIDDLRKRVGKIPGLEKLTYSQKQGGPPVGKAVSLGVRGKSYQDILPAVESVKAFLKTIKGTFDVDDSYLVGKSELQIKVDSVEAAAASLSLASIGNSVRAAYEGVVATSIRELDEKIDVRVSLENQEKDSKSSLMSMLIPNQRGNLVALNRVARLEHSEGVALYEHENNQRQVKVTAGVNEKVTSSGEVNSLLRSELNNFRQKHSNVDYFFGGEDQDSRDSIASLTKAFVIAAMGIFMILILTFRNIFQPFLVLFVTIPLGIMTVVWTFYLHGRPLTFLGMLGVVALAGVIVNNAIVLVSFINEERKNGVDRFTSIVNGAKMRLRPIFLTTLTTVAGILPTAYGWGGLDPFVVPIALGLGWGIFFGAFLTTIVFPASLAVLDDIHILINKKLSHIFGI